MMTKSPCDSLGQQPGGLDWLIAASWCRASYLFLVLTICAGVESAIAADIERSFKIPVLIVTADDSGSCVQAEFTLSRKASRKLPLTVAIAEDTPGGAGESLRASVWMAAMVTALDRLDDMAGVKISLEMSDPVDGPSAGAVICLAIMTALDEKEFPSDCAITGTIMPDGTVGSVGSVAAKMRAAAKAGAKRVVVPAYLRFEKDLKSGQEVDLKRLAAELKLEFIAAENIAQAYRAVHRLPDQSPARPGREVLELPEAVEEMLKQRYRELLASGTKSWGEIPEASRKAVEADPIIANILVTPKAKAENAWRAGRLFYAHETIAMWDRMLRSYRSFLDFFQNIKAEDSEKAFAQVDKKTRELLQSLPAPTSLLLSSSKIDPVTGTQMCGDCCDVYSYQSMIWWFQRRGDSVIAELSKTENSADEKQKPLRARLWEVKCVQLLYAFFATESVSSLAQEQQRWAKTLPHRPIVAESSSVERLFFSAFTAANNSFQKDVVAAVASSMNAGTDQALGAMFDADMSFVTYSSIPESLGQLHKSLAKTATTQPQSNPPRSIFATAAAAATQPSQYAPAIAAFAAAKGLASVSELIMRWSELDVQNDGNGGLRYGRTDLLNYLLNAARENAMLNIAQCKKRSIPCIEPIVCFERAELDRDDTGQDKVSVLADYWKASLQAKVLLMLFRQADHPQK